MYDDETKPPFLSARTRARATFRRSRATMVESRDPAKTGNFGEFEGRGEEARLRMNVAISDAVAALFMFFACTVYLASEFSRVL